MPIVTMKVAVAAAKEALRDLYEDDPLRNLALEELELVTESDRSLWAITFGFYRLRSVKVQQNALADLYSPKRTEIEDRVYKTVYVDADSGEFVKMDMRPSP
jgi:hypothetical protein